MNTLREAVCVCVCVVVVGGGGGGGVENHYDSYPGGIRGLVPHHRL